MLPKSLCTHTHAINPSVKYFTYVYANVPPQANYKAQKANAFSIRPQGHHTKAWLIINIKTLSGHFSARTYIRTYITVAKQLTKACGSYTYLV